MGGVKEIGPDLGLDEDQSSGADGVECPVDGAGQVHGVVQDGDIGGEFAAGDGVAGGGGGRQHDRLCWIMDARGGDEFGGDQYFADAHGVDPPGFEQGVELGGDRWAEVAEALAEVMHGPAAPAHFEELSGQGGHEDCRQGGIVERPQGPWNHSALGLGFFLTSRNEMRLAP